MDIWNQIRDFDLILQRELNNMDYEMKDVPRTPKRRRGDNPELDKAIRKAIAVSAKMNRKFPYADYGREYVRRGTEQNIARYGATYKLATPEQRLTRKQTGYIGRGKYRGRGMYLAGRGGFFGDLWDGIKDIGKSAASVVATPLGSLAGNLVTGALGKIGGRGAYNVNQLIQNAGSFDVPSFTPTPDATAITISHREYIGNLYGPSSINSFVNQTYSINPGLENTFPWLSQIAANFDEYSMKQLIFTFRSTVADFASGTGQVGQVIMTTQYNTASKPFTDKAIMMQYDGAMSGKVTEHMLHGVECDPAKLSGSEGKYIRTQPVLIDQDLSDYDLGTLNVAVADIPSGYINQSLGELWVSYTIELRKPRFYTGRGLAISRDVYRGAEVLGGTREDYVSPFGLIAAPEYVQGQQNNIGTLLRGGRVNGVTLGMPSLETIDGIRRAPAVAVWNSAFELVIPANYAGALRINMFIRTDAAQINPPFHLYGVGNLRPLVDLLGQNGSAVLGNNFFWAGQPSSDTTQTNAFIWDIVVSPATNGQDNILYFTLEGFNGIATSVDWVMLDIKELNSSFCYEQDGTNDSIIWVNPKSKAIVA